MAKENETKPRVVHREDGETVASMLQRIGASKKGAEAIKDDLGKRECAWISRSGKTLSYLSWPDGQEGRVEE